MTNRAVITFGERGGRLSGQRVLPIKAAAALARDLRYVLGGEASGALARRDFAVSRRARVDGRGLAHGAGMSATVTAAYLMGIEDGRERFTQHGLTSARRELDNLRRTIRGFAASSDVGQMLRGERDFWMHQMRIAESAAKRIARPLVAVPQTNDDAGSEISS